MSDMNLSADSSELEALFDTVAAKTDNNQMQPAPPLVVSPPKKSALMQHVLENDSLTSDSSDLEALFDSIAVKKAETKTTQETAPSLKSDDAAWSEQQQGKVFMQVGQMARQLHDTLGGLGFDKLIENTVNALPDAKDRLAYIANLTEQAAYKVLNATDVANPLQDEMEEGAALLDAKWDKLYANQMSPDDFKLLASETRAFLKSAIPQRTSATKVQLMEIMMAQDFQDLTGQVIKKIVSVSQDLENQLMGILIDTMPGEKRTESVNSLLNGPVINAVGRTDVVASQTQVDDLLDSLGF